MKLTKKYWLISLIAPVLAVLLYSNTFNHGYVLDDFDAIVDNRIVKQGLDGISEIWATEYRQDIPLIGAVYTGHLPYLFLPSNGKYGHINRKQPT